MRLHWILVLTATALLPAQAPAKTPAGKPATPAAGATGAVHATLADLQRDFREKKLAALEAYVKVRGTAADAAEALVEAAGIATALERHDHAVRYAERYLKEHASGPAVFEMRLTRAGGLRASGDAAGAEKAFQDAIDNAGDDINGLVGAASTFGEMLVEGGKKDAAVAMLTKVGESRPEVGGLKEHLAGVAKTYELIGTAPIAITQPDLEGKPIDLASYKGKVLLLDFWATWCGPCVGELPNVLAAYEKYHAKGFEIVGISLDQEREKLDKFLAERKVTWRQNFDGKGWKNEVAVAYGVQSIPATYLIGPDGKIVSVGLRGEQLMQRLARFYPEKAEKAAAPPAKGK